MDQKVSKSDKIVTVICVSIIIFVFLAAILMAFTRLVLVKRFGMKNAYTDFLFAGNSVLNNGDEYVEGLDNENEDAEEVDGGGEYEVEIEWRSLYPFAHEEKQEVDIVTPVDKYKDFVLGVEGRFSPYVSEYVLGYDKETELANGYDKFIGWNLVSYSEYNGITQMSDGYLTELCEGKDTPEMSEALISFKDFVKKQGAEFLYVQAPYKVSEYDDTDISGYTDFSNQNANAMISDVKSNGVDVCDLREYIHEEELHNHDMFYKTDHHWTTTSGLWGAQKILEYCNEKYGFKADAGLLDLDKFNQEVYEDWFLGSQGKKVTLARTEPEDFTLLYPKYETKFHYVIPSMNIDDIGDYSICYDMSQVEEKDFYGKSPYGGCNYGDQPVITIDNELDSDNKKILIIHDSFGDCLISALALCEKRVDSLDIRHFDGSVEVYIKEAKPDIVMVMYNAGGIGGEIDWTTHASMFDFR